MQYGYFDDKEKEYVITRPDTPQSWSNYLGTTEYGAIITNNAGGYGFYKSGAKGRFLRLRDSEGALVATRSFFPARLEESVRQKTRWIHGIALQAWDRLGWTGRLIDIWMAMRDRRGPLTALVLFVAYLLVLIEGLVMLGAASGLSMPEPLSPGLETMLRIAFFALVWRMVFRFGFTAHEYGWAEGLRAVLRLPVDAAIEPGIAALTQFWWP